MAGRCTEPRNSAVASEASLNPSRDSIALDDLAKLIALAEVRFPTDLSQEDSSKLVEKVRTHMRKRLLRFIADTIANRLAIDRKSDIKPDTEESTHAAANI